MELSYRALIGSRSRARKSESVKWHFSILQITRYLRLGDRVDCGIWDNETSNLVIALLPLTFNAPL